MSIFFGGTKKTELTNKPVYDFEQFLDAATADGASWDFEPITKEQDTEDDAENVIH